MNGMTKSRIVFLVSLKIERTDIICERRESCYGDILFNSISILEEDRFLCEELVLIKSMEGKDMAQLQIDFFSHSLKRMVTMMGVVPIDRPMIPGWPQPYEGPFKSLYLLHGYSGNCKDWISGTNIQELAMKYNIAVFMPSGDNNFYIDDPDVGAHHSKFIGEEVIEITRKMFPLSHKREDTFIGGFSMGGYGSLRTGLIFSDTFGKILPISSALIAKQIHGLPKDFKDPMADYLYYHRVFGDLDSILESDRNLEVLIDRLIVNKSKIPEIFMFCGREDFLIEHNRDFSNFLKLKKINYQYQEFQGAHDWNFVNGVLESGTRWLVGSQNESLEANR